MLVIKEEAVCRFVLIASMLLFASGLAGKESDNTLHLYNWEAFLSAKVIGDFYEETGIHLKETFFADEGIRDEVMLSDRRNSFDLVVVESVRLQLLAQQGAISSLSLLRQDIERHYDDKWLNACGDYGIPYAWGTSGILYRKSAFDKPVTSWNDLLQPTMALNDRIAMYYHPIDLVASALLSIGSDPFDTDRDELLKAYSILESQRPFINTQNYILNYISTPSKLSEIDIAYGFSGDAYVLNTEAKGQEDKWEYVTPKEGTTIWLECLAVPAGVKMTNQIETLIKYLSQPKVAALNAEDTWFSTPNKSALQFVSENYLQDPVLNPPHSIIANSYLYRPVSELGLLTRQRMVEELR
ncbi:PotD/PotF family extracellular solute-binding protein [Vibrio sp. E150_011]